MSANSSRSSASPRARGEASGGRRSCGTVRGEGADSNPHAFRPGLSAAQVDRELKSAVQNWRSAERCVVLWFAELHRRRLFAKLGYGSIHLYASEALGFSRGRSYQFLKLAERLKNLPAVRKAVASGDLGWTKARAVASVATTKTQKEWLQRAQTSSRRELEREIDRTRQRIRAARTIPVGQLALGSSAGLVEKAKEKEKEKEKDKDKDKDESVSKTRPGQEGQSAKLGKSKQIGNSAQDEQSAQEKQSAQEVQAARERSAEIPLSLSITLTAEQLARYEALLAQMRRRGHREAKGELLLAALECLLEDSETAERTNDRRGRPQARHAIASATTSRVAASPYQVHIQHCPRCASATVATSRGDQSIDRGTLEAALCDAKLKRSGQRTRSSLPPRLRRKALERDRHRCRMPGCGHRQFLAVHHIVARKDGGKHELANLITLCAACHRALHALSDAKQRELLQPVTRKGR